MKLRSALAALAVSVSFVVPGCVAPAAAQEAPICATVQADAPKQPERPAITIGG